MLFLNKIYYLSLEIGKIIYLKVYYTYLYTRIFILYISFVYFYNISILQT